MNPSKRKERAKFLIHIGKGFIVPSYSIKTDTLEPPILGDNTPEAWLISLCNEVIQEKDPHKSCFYKTFEIEIEIKKLKHVPKFDSPRVILKYKQKREGEWFITNISEKKNVNPSRRKAK